MQTHRDDDSPDLKELRRQLDAVPAKDRMAVLEERAGRMVDACESEITAGRAGEGSLGEFMQFGVLVRRLPDDEECRRISIGEVVGSPEIRYLVFRGDPDDCAALLERTARALRSLVKKF